MKRPLVQMRGAECMIITEATSLCGKSATLPNSSGEEMENNMWSKVLQTLSIVGGELGPVSQSDLDQFETETGFKLPKSYRDFCTLLGPGTLAHPGNYRIVAPKANGGQMEELRRFNRFAHDCNQECELYCQNPEQVKRAWFFGTDIGTSWFFWDSVETTNPKNYEYSVFVLYRDYDVERLASSFWEFVNDICLESGLPGYAKVGPITKTFEPLR
jgi:hypothetical protein